MTPDYLAIEFTATLCSFVLVTAIVSWHLNKVNRRLDQTMDSIRGFRNVFVSFENHYQRVIEANREKDNERYAELRSLITNIGLELKGEIIHSRHKRKRGPDGKYKPTDK